MKIVILLLFLFTFLPSTIFAGSLNDVNQKICDRFEGDVTKLAAIMEELRRRKGITETRVAFGGIDTQIKSADYWITSAAEAVAYQRIQKYSSQSQLRSSLEILRNKILKAKSEVKNALDEK